MNKSFTLIEILVVIVVIGVLSAFILVGMSSITSKANIAKGQAFANSLNNSLLLAKVSEWNFNNLTGTVGQDVSTAANFIKDSWLSNDGTATGAPNLEESSCVTGKCLSFNGNTDYIECGNNNSLSMRTTLTLSAWIKLSNVTSPVYQTIINHGLQISNGEYWLYLTNGRVSFEVGNGTSCSFREQLSLALDTSWHYVALSFDNGNSKAYVDSLVTGTWGHSISDTLGGSQTLIIGSYPGSHRFNGSIDDVRIYNQAIPTSQIQQNYFIGLNNLYKNRGLTQIEYIERLTELKNNLTQQ